MTINQARVEMGIEPVSSNPDILRPKPMTPEQVEKLRKDWEATYRGDAQARTEAGKAAPNFESMVELAKSHPQPQEWYDEDFSGL